MSKYTEAIEHYTEWGLTEVGTLPDRIEFERIIGEALQTADRLENITLPPLEDYTPRYMQGFLDGWYKAIDTIRGDKE